MECVEQMANYKTSPEGILFDIQLDRPTKKYNRKVGTYHVGLRLSDMQTAQPMIDELINEQKSYTDINNLSNDIQLSLPYFDTTKMGFINKGIEFNPFRMNSCGWSGKLNNVYLNIPKIFNAEGKELDHARMKDFRDKEMIGRLFYGVEGYNNQEGVGVILRLRGVQINYETPHNQIAV